MAARVFLVENVSIIKVVNTPVLPSVIYCCYMFVFTVLEMMLGHLGGDVVGVRDHRRSMDQKWDKDTVLGHVCSKVNKYCC